MGGLGKEPIPKAQKRFFSKSNNNFRGIMATIQLSLGLVATVDDEDYQELSKFKWSSSFCNNRAKVYAVRAVKINGKSKTIRMHRTIMNVNDDRIVDHINGDTLDNRKSNLRVVSVQQNNMNRHKSCAKSGIKGVTQRKSGKWWSRIQKNGRAYYLGTFESAEQAEEAYKIAALKLFGEFAPLSSTDGYKP